MIQKTGFARNAAIVACKEAANENDETRKRFEVMCREVFKKFKACINAEGSTLPADRDAINIVYMSLQKDREQADITDIIRQLHQVVDEAIETKPDTASEQTSPTTSARSTSSGSDRSSSGARQRTPRSRTCGRRSSNGCNGCCCRTRCVPTSSGTTKTSWPSTTGRRTG